MDQPNHRWFVSRLVVRKPCKPSCSRGCICLWTHDVTSLERGPYSPTAPILLGTLIGWTIEDANKALHRSVRLPRVSASAFKVIGNPLICRRQVMTNVSQLSDNRPSLKVSSRHLHSRRIAPCEEVRCSRSGLSTSIELAPPLKAPRTICVERFRHNLPAVVSLVWVAR